MNMRLLEEAVLMGMIPKTFVDNLKHRRCPLCGKSTKNLIFKDKLSEREFIISGMCQECQDNVFNEKNE